MYEKGDINMTKESIYQELINMINKQLQLGLDIKINIDTPLIEIGIDSIGLMMLVVLIEENFNLMVDEEDIVGSNFNYIGELVDYISSKINNLK